MSKKVDKKKLNKLIRIYEIISIVQAVIDCLKSLQELIYELLK